MSRNRPPLTDVPMFAPCPACAQVLRARVDFTRSPSRGSLACPWCRRQVTVTAPRGR